ncbi:hypothetical protein, partial [Bacillus marinisedimentorum]|uniref:hypothetical protein n=1 Tax=Bacillus marinisedimentorum TaxID=1821260 RepID=UPI000B10D03F
LNRIAKQIGSGMKPRSYGLKTGLNGAKHALQRESRVLWREIMGIARETLAVWRERHGIPRESASLSLRLLGYGV